MEQMKLLSLDFGREHKERKTLVEEAIRNIQEKVSLQDRRGFWKRYERNTDLNTGNGTSKKEVERRWRKWGMREINC